MHRFRPTSRQAITVLSAGCLGAYAQQHWINSSEETSLNPSTFAPFTLVKKEPVSSTSSIFTLRPSSPISDQTSSVWDKGIWSVQIKQPQLQIARAYTPLPSRVQDKLDSDARIKDEDTLRLLVRREQHGEVSNYLHRLPQGSMLELRGPTQELELAPHVKEVVFLAGGTGIAPAMQIANALRGRANVSILWANRKREDCLGGTSNTPHAQPSGILGGLWGSSARTVPLDPPSKEENNGANATVVQLREMQQAYTRTLSAKLSVRYFVDEEKTFIGPNDIKALTSHIASADQPGSRVLIVSGPDGFVNHWAGPKQWSGGRQVQGPIGGILGQLSLKDWSVVKL